MSAIEVVAWVGMGVLSFWLVAVCADLRRGSQRRIGGGK